MKDGLNLKWWQVILLCIMFGGFSWRTLVSADNAQKEVNHQQNTVIEKKLDKEEFKEYRTEHKIEASKLVAKVEAKFEKVEQQVIDSRLEIVKILERIEKKQ